MTAHLGFAIQKENQIRSRPSTRTPERRAGHQHRQSGLDLARDRGRARYRKEAAGSLGCGPRRWTRHSISSVSGLRVPPSEQVAESSARNRTAAVRSRQVSRHVGFRIPGGNAIRSVTSASSGRKSSQPDSTMIPSQFKSSSSTLGEIPWQPQKRKAEIQSGSNLILQGKGGVGKSLVSAILGQYFHARKGTLHCFDTDPVNATFAQYQALAAEHINVLRRGAIYDKRFDELIEKICQVDGICIVDTGATTFVPLWNYILENETLGFLLPGHAGSLSTRLWPADRQ